MNRVFYTKARTVFVISGAVSGNIIIKITDDSGCGVVC